MHEVAVAQRMLDIVLQTAQENGGGKIIGMRLILGSLTCVEPETLSFAFNIAARGTAAEDCRMEVVRLNVKLRCLDCGAEDERDLLAPCTACGNNGGDIIQGRELRLDTIDLDEDNTPN